MRKNWSAIWLGLGLVLGVLGLVLSFGAVVNHNKPTGGTRVTPAPIANPTYTDNGGGMILADMEWQRVSDNRPPVKAKGQTVYVVNRLPKAYPVKSAVKFVDRYTTSKVKFVSKCPANAWRCFTFKAGAVKGNWKASLARADWNWYGGVITVDTKDSSRAGLNAAQRKWMLVHEFGHAQYIPHRESCATSMYQFRRCLNGKVPPLRFDASQKRTMRHW